MKTDRQALRSVTIFSMTMNTVLAAFKVAIGQIGHSQALIADGLHSFSDLISDILVYLAARAGQKGADHDHPYGHHRIETLAALVIAVLLVIVGCTIAYSTLERVFMHGAHVLEASPLVTLVAAVSVACNELLYRYTKKVGEKLESSLLIANAWHNRSDAWVSLIVVISSIGSYFGVHYLDAVAAIVIAILIIRMGFKMIWNNVKELVDTGVDEKTREAIVLCIRNIPGIVAIHQLRTRSLGGRIFVDVHVLVPPRLSVSEGHFISEQVHHALAKEFPHITDTTVHIDPEDDEQYCKSAELPNRPAILKLLEKAWSTLPAYAEIQTIHLHYLMGKLEVDVFFPISVFEKNGAALEKQYEATAMQVDSDIQKVQFLYRNIEK